MPRNQAHAFAHAGAAATVDQHRWFGVRSGKRDPAGEAAEPISGDGRPRFAFDGQQGLAVISKQVDLIADMIAPEE